MTNKEDGYQVVKTNNEDNTRETAILQEVPIIEIEGIGQYSKLTTLQEALNNLESNTEYNIKVLQNIDIDSTENAITIPEGITATLDFNGMNINTSNNNTIINNGTLNIVDTSEQKTSTITNSGNRTLIQNNGIMNINDIQINESGRGASNSYKTLIKNTGTLELNNVNITGTATSYSSDYKNIIYNETKGALTINGGNINVKDGRIYSNSTADFIMENATIKCYRTDVYYGTGNIIINGTSDIYNYEGICNNTTGNVIVNGGKVSNYGYYSIRNFGVNSNYGNIDINGGTVLTIDSNGGNITINGEDAIVNNINLTSSANFTLEEGTVNYIQGNNNSIINIYGGIVNAGVSSTAININSSDSICNIGKDDETVNTNSSNIIGKISNIDRMNSNINYYDGKITTSSSYYGVYGSITNIPDGYEVNINKDSSENNVMTLEQITGVCTIGDIEYNSIQEAIQECNESNNTITLQKNIFQIRKIEIDSTKDVKIDLNGKWIYTYAKDILIQNNGTLEILDSSEGQTGKVQGATKTYINNTNKLIINGGYYNRNISIRDMRVIDNNESGTVEWKEGKVYLYANSDYAQYCIYTTSSAEIKIDNIDSNLRGCRVTHYYSPDTYSEQYIVYSKNNTESLNTITITTLNIKSIDYGKKYGIYDATGKANINISNNIGKGLTYAVYSYATNSSELNITGATVNSDIYFKGQTANISNATISKITLYATTNIEETANITELNAYGKTTVNGAQIETINNCSNTTINNGTIGKIYNDKGKLQINGGTIKNTNGYGILNNSGATLTIGTNDDIVGITSPVIDGSTYGVNNKGTFNFYDGVIIGKEKAIYGEVTNTPELYQASSLENGTKSILELIAMVEKIATVDGIYYNTLQSAINAAANTSGTIVLHKDVNNLTSSLQIQEGNNITLDLNGYSITYEGEDEVIVNNGTLRIIDSLSNEEGEQEIISKIENTQGKAIRNNGQVILGIDDEKTNANSPTIKGGIEGAGTVTIYDGKVE